MSSQKQTASTRGKKVAALVILPLVILVSVGTILVQVDQQALAQRLAGQNPADRSEALKEVRAMGLESATPALRMALIEALDAESAKSRARWEAARRGEFVPERNDDYDFYGRVTQAVVELRDPRSIPVLARALGTGLMVIRALVAFGEQAAPAVLDVVVSPESRPNQVDDGLNVLRRLVDDASVRPLTTVTRARIRGVALQRLTGKQTPATVLDAINLAVSLGDADLMKLVESLATEESQVRAMGIVDPSLIQHVQERAASALAKAKGPVR